MTMETMSTNIRGDNSMENVKSRIMKTCEAISLFVSLILCIVAVITENEFIKWFLICILILQVLVIGFLLYEVLRRKKLKNNVVELVEAIFSVTVIMLIILSVYCEMDFNSNWIFGVGIFFSALLGISSSIREKTGD